MALDLHVPGQGRMKIDTIGMGELLGWSWLFPPYRWAFGAVAASPVEAVEAVIEAAGETRSLQLLAGMPAQRDWPREAVLRRFLGVRSGRKARYAELLVDALEPDRVPDPLTAVLERALRPGAPGS